MPLLIYVLLTTTFITVLSYPLLANWQLRGTVPTKHITEKNKLDVVIPSFVTKPPPKEIAKSIKDIQHELKIQEPIHPIDPVNLEGTPSTGLDLYDIKEPIEPILPGPDPCPVEPVCGVLKPYHVIPPCSTDCVHPHVHEPIPPKEPEVLPPLDVPCCNCCCEPCCWNTTVPCYNIPWGDWTCSGCSCRPSCCQTPPWQKTSNPCCCFQSPSCCSTNSPCSPCHSSCCTSSSSNTPTERSYSSCTTPCSCPSPDTLKYRCCYDSRKVDTAERPCVHTNMHGEIEVRPKIPPGYGCCNSSCCCPCCNHCCDCCYPPSCCNNCCPLPSSSCCSNCNSPLICNCCGNCNSLPPYNCSYTQPCSPCTQSQRSYDCSCSPCNNCPCQQVLPPCHCCCKDLDCETQCVCVDANGKPNIKLQPRPFCPGIKANPTPKPKLVVITKKMSYPTIKLHRPIIAMPDIPEMPPHPSLRSNLKKRFLDAIANKEDFYASVQHGKRQ